MSITKNLAYTLTGLPIDSINIPIGSSVVWTLTLEDADTQEVLDLTGCTVIMSLCTLDAGAATEPPVFAREADLDADPTTGICTVTWAYSDTVPSGEAIDPGIYGIDVWLIDSDGNRVPMMAFSTIRMTIAGTLPDVVVVPLPAQVPLGLGPNVGHEATLADFPDPADKEWLFYVAVDTGIAYYSNGVSWIVVSGSAAGTVTSVGLSLPSIFTVGGSPVTTSGTLSATLATQAANLVFAGPGTGVDASPTFRALVAADFPVTGVSAASYGSAASVGTFTVDTAGRLSAAGSTSIAIGDSAITYAARAANLVWAGPNTGSASAPTFRSLVAADIPSLSGTYLPLAGGTMTGGLLATDNSYDIGASGATRFRTAYMGTSVVSPLYASAAASALTITGHTTSTWSLDSGDLTVAATSGSGTLNLLATTGTVNLATGAETTIGIGNSSSTASLAGTVNITGVVGQNINFKKEINQAITVSASTTAATVGGGLSVFAGQGAAGANGGTGSFRGGVGGAGSGATPGGAGGGTNLAGAVGGAASASAAAGAGANVTLLSGAGGSNALGGGGAASGTLTIDTGAATGAATAGVINFGTSSASAIAIGRSGITTTLAGTVALAAFSGSASGTYTLGGTVTITNPAINGATSSGSTAIDLSGNSGAFKTTTGASTFGGSSNTFTNAATISATTNQLSLGASAHITTISSTAPSGASQTLTIPDCGGADTFVFTTLGQTLASKTLTAPTLNGTITLGATPVFSGTLTGTFNCSAVVCTTIAPSSTATFSGGVVMNHAMRPHRVTVNDAAYTMLVSDSIIAYTALSADRIVTGIVTGGASASPQFIMIKNESGTAHNITFTPNSGQIDNASSKIVITTGLGWWMGYVNGTNAFTIAQGTA